MSLIRVWLDAVKEYTGPHGALLNPLAAGLTQRRLRIDVAGVRSAYLAPLVGSFKMILAVPDDAHREEPSAAAGSGPIFCRAAVAAHPRSDWVHRRLRNN